MIRLRTPPDAQRRRKPPRTAPRRERRQPRRCTGPAASPSVRARRATSAPAALDTAPYPCTLFLIDHSDAASLLTVACTSNARTRWGHYGEVGQNETISLRFDVERGQDFTHCAVALVAGRDGAQPELDDLHELVDLVRDLHELLLLVEEHSVRPVRPVIRD